MPYASERYTQGTSCYCERHKKLYNTNVYATNTRMVIFDASGNNSYLMYLCRDCINEIAHMMSADIPNSGSFTFDWENMKKQMVTIPPKVSLTTTHLRDTLSRYEGEWRAMKPKIRGLTDGYTNRNTIIRDMDDLIKKIMVAVDTFIQKTA